MLVNLILFFRKFSLLKFGFSEFYLLYLQRNQDYYEANI